jgi:hypothetical protein
MREELPAKAEGAQGISVVGGNERTLSFIPLPLQFLETARITYW